MRHGKETGYGVYLLQRAFSRYYDLRQKFRDLQRRSGDEVNSVSHGDGLEQEGRKVGWDGMGVGFI